jgi:hypothetical protein
MPWRAEKEQKVMPDLIANTCRLAVSIFLLCLALQAASTRPLAAIPQDAYVTCQLAEDGVTDDGPALNACLAAHPGRHILLRKAGGPSHGGGQATSKDIYSSQTLTLVGDAQWLDCDVPSLWAGGCRIDFDPALNGPGIAVPPTAYGVEISNLEVYGGNCWSPTDLTTYTLPPRINGLGNDGILLAGGEPKLVNVQANCFKRHGISVLGDSSAYDFRTYGYSQPDFVRFERVGVGQNKAYGVFITGADSNAGLITFIDARVNQLGGIYDHSQLGNTWIAPGFHSNTRSPDTAGPAQALASISVTDNVATIIATADLEKTLTPRGNWITTTGSTDASFNGTCKVTAVHLQARTLTCRFPHSNGSTKAGTVQRAASSSVYAVYATVSDGSEIPAKWKIAGPFSGRGGSSSTIVVNPYCESDEQTPDFGGKTLVLGGNCDGIDTNWSHGGIRAFNGGLSFDTSGSSGVSMTNRSDHSNFLQIRAGKTTDQDMGLEFSGHDAKPRFSIYRTGGGTVFFRDWTNKGIIPLSFSSGADTSITASGSTSPLNIQQNSTGDLMFYSNTPTSTRMKSAGNFVFGDPTKPAITVQTGAEYGVLYAAQGNELALGFTGSNTAQPASPVATFNKKTGARFDVGISTPKLTGIADTTVVANLNADTVDGKHASSFALSGFADLAYTPTPTFDGGAANTFKITLKGNVTSSRLANVTPGEQLNFIVCQDAPGGRTFAWPANVRGGSAPGTQPGTCSTQSFIFDGTNAFALTPGIPNQ